MVIIINAIIVIIVTLLHALTAHELGLRFYAVLNGLLGEPRTSVQIFDTFVVRVGYTGRLQPAPRIPAVTAQAEGAAAAAAAPGRGIHERGSR